MLIIDASGRALAQKLATILASPIYTPNFNLHKSGEYKVLLEHPTKNRDVLIVADMNNNFTESLLKLLLLIDAVKNQGARKIMLFVPYLSYMRQDKSSANCSAISAKVIAQIISKSAIDLFITLDLHSPLAANYFTCKLINISFFDIFSDYLLGLSKDTIIVSPDQGALFRTNKIATKLGLATAQFVKRHC